MSGAPDEWVRWLPLWDAYFVLVSAAAVGIMTASGRTSAIALLAVLVVGHLAVGRRLIRSGRGSRAAWGYQAAVVLLFAPAVWLAPISAVLLSALAPAAYMMVGPVVGTGVVLALNLAWLGPAELGNPVVAAGIVTVPSAVIGVWISKIIKQSKQRATLIDELEATRAEVARLSYEAGRAAEREAVADTIHDTIAQGLSSTIMLLQAARLHPDRAEAHLELAELTSRENLADARALISARTVPESTPVSLVDALRREVDRLRDVHGLDAVLRVDGAPDPGNTACSVDLLRIAQEGLANVRKHAAASRVQVVLSADASRVRVEVHDDGRGFVPGDAPRGHGLPLMRRRLLQAGGTLELDSVPGAGTVLRAEVPA